MEYNNLRVAFQANASNPDSNRPHHYSQLMNQNNVQNKFTEVNPNQGYERMLSLEKYMTNENYTENFLNDSQPNVTVQHQYSKGLVERNHNSEPIPDQNQANSIQSNTSYGNTIVTAQINAIPVRTMQTLEDTTTSFLSQTQNTQTLASHINSNHNQSIEKYPNHIRLNHNYTNNAFPVRTQTFPNQKRANCKKSNSSAQFNFQSQANSIQFLCDQRGPNKYLPQVSHSSLPPPNSPLPREPSDPHVRSHSLNARQIWLARVTLIRINEFFEKTFGGYGNFKRLVFNTFPRGENTSLQELRNFLG